MPSALDASRERWNRDRRRLSPNIASATTDGLELTVVFDRDMDEGQNTAVIRLVSQTNDILEFTDFSWSDDRTLTSSSFTNEGAFTGQPYVVYLDGNIRARERFVLKQGSRTYEVSEV